MDMINFETYVENANKATSKQELFEIYSKTVLQHGLDRILLCLATDHRDIGDSAGMGFMHNYPEEWMKYYFEKGLDKIDPVMIYSLGQLGTYLWDDIPKNMKLFKPQKQCLDMGREAGLNFGLCTPLRGPNNAIAGLSLASSVKKDGFDGNIDMITAYSNHFYLAYRRLGRKQVIGKEAGEYPASKNLALTEKEREILTWAAAGKSLSDISILLSISENTIKFHMKKIYKKFGVHDRINAVVVGLTYGLIRL